MSRGRVLTSRAAAALLALLAATPLVSRAAEERLAVLEFTGKGIEPEILSAITERARSGALEPARQAGYAVMTRQSTALVLQEMGGMCVEDQCEIELARNVGAGLVVTGHVQRIAASVMADLKLHETAKGKLLAVETIEAGNEVEVLRIVSAATGRLLAAGFERYFGAPVVARRPDARVESSFRKAWSSPGWNVGLVFDHEKFAGPDALLRRDVGGQGLVRVGYGGLGLKLGTYFPSNDLVVGFDLLRDAGLGFTHKKKGYTIVLLVPDLEVTWLPLAKVPANGTQPEAKLNAVAVRFGISGLGLRTGKWMATLRPSGNFWMFPGGDYMAWSIGYSISVARAF